jgi:hypothetical protein
VDARLPAQPLARSGDIDLIAQGRRCSGPVFAGRPAQEFFNRRARQPHCGLECGVDWPWRCDERRVLRGASSEAVLQHHPCSFTQRSTTTRAWTAENPRLVWKENEWRPLLL